ncbi:hypothetical protein CPARA_1gp072 (nucleomorph) [Cryptomonas paramecium]|uniref:Transmembrane protein n=1 Tax=Cryptomonas paramaecium TaxID=2898 RepID=F2HHD4_9CRYP|nr:hypothetical protein CPARA_1gp072 [Cryptomonas paramecium]AEA38730.1 hypothetical protein CPARA_1gp072 [Cryptomonas paramecium]
MHIVKQGVSVFIRNNFIVNMLFINFARFLLIFFQIFKYISNFVKKTFKKIGQKAKHYIDFFYQDFPLKWLSETTDVLIWFENFIILGLMCFFFLLMIIFNIRKCIVLLKNMCPGCLVFQIFHKKNFLTTIRFFFFQIIIHLIFFTRIFLIHQENEFNIRKNFFFYQLSVCLFLMLDSYRLSLYAKFHIKKKTLKFCMFILLKKY